MAPARRQRPVHKRRLLTTHREKTHYKIKRILRWIWQDRNRYTWQFSPDDASTFLDYLIKYDDIPEPQVAEYKKTITILFNYRNATNNDNIQWDYRRSIKSSYDSERDHFTADELRALYEASLASDTSVSAERESTDKPTDLIGG